MIRIRWYAPLFVFYWMISLHANAQENSSAATLIRDIYSNWFNDRPFAYQECDTFFYSDKVDTAIMNKVKANFLSDKEFKEWDPDQAAYVKRKTRFTLEERRYIVAQLDLIKNMKWQAKMFPFAYMIDRKSVV